MKILLTILVAAAAAFGGRALAGSREAAAEPAAAPDTGANADALREALAAARAESRRLEQELAKREGSRLVAAQAPQSGVDDAAIAAALERWHAANPPEQRAAAEAAREAAARAAAGEVDLAAVPIDELVRALRSNGFGSDSQQELFQRVREAGRMDEYVAAIEALAAANPDDAGLQVTLGHAYLQKLFGMAPSQEAGILATRSDEAFDRALELDDHNWSARFSKAVALSNWPAFMGRGPEAIENFEVLIEQQEAQPARPEFAMSYVFLGNVLQSSGKPAEALATWRAGLERFPDARQLREAIELAERNVPSADGKRDAR